MGYGAIAPDPQRQMVPPTTKADSWFWQNVMMRSSRHQSFTLIPLVLIVVSGSVLILVSWNVDQVTAWIQLRYSRGLVLRQLWEEDDMLSSKSGAMRLSLRSRELFDISSSLCELGNDGTAAPPQYAGALKEANSDLKPAISLSWLWSKLPPEPPRDSRRTTMIVEDVGLAKSEQPKHVLPSNGTAATRRTILRDILSDGYDAEVYVSQAA